MEEREKSELDRLRKIVECIDPRILQKTENALSKDGLTQEQIKLLATARPHVAIEDYNSNFFLIGLEHGAEVNGGSIVSGSGMSELSGFTLTLEGQETDPAFFVTSTVITDNESAVQIDPNA